MPRPPQQFEHGTLVEDGDAEIGNLLAGAVIIETVFAWPGIGRLMFESLTARDYNTLLGVFLVSAAMVIAFNIITDIVYRLIDPRI